MFFIRKVTGSYGILLFPVDCKRNTNQCEQWLILFSLLFNIIKNLFITTFAIDCVIVRLFIRIKSYFYNPKPMQNKDEILRDTIHPLSGSMGKIKPEK